MKVLISFGHWIVILVLTLNSCSLYYDDTDTQSPRDLLTTNDVVFEGELVTIDTLFTIGVQDYYYKPYNIIAVLYKFKVMAMIKGDSLCHRIGILSAERCGYPNYEPTDSSELLGYGNILKHTDSAYYCYYPILWTSSSEKQSKLVSSYREGCTLLNSEEYIGIRHVFKNNDHIMDSILNEDSAECILYPTEWGLKTSYFIRKGSYMAYTDKNGYREIVSRQEYINIIKEYAQ